jgi:ribosomal protein L11 methyltransferase
MSMDTFSVVTEVNFADADTLAAELMEAGAGGVEVRDASVLPMPGADPIPEGRAVVVAFFDARDKAEREAKARGGKVVPVPDRDWNQEWKKGFDAFTIGRVFVRPSWVKKRAERGQVEIILDPGLAFGTGTHPTTALCLAAIDAFLERNERASVLDVGTGSGLLAIAARKLGAGKVVGTDNDIVALRVAAENAAENRVTVSLASEDLSKVKSTFDLVVANILANTLVELAPAIARKVEPKGTLLLSGILREQEEEVAAAYVARGLIPKRGARSGEWSMLRFEAPARINGK